MITIGNKRYPNDFDGIMAKSTLEGFLRDQLKAEYDYHLMEFLEEKFDPEHLFNTYLQNSLDKGVNIPGKLFAKAAALAGDWDNKDWVGLVNDARNFIKALMRDNAIERMFKTKQFLDYHKAQGGTLTRAAVAPEEQSSPEAPKVVQAAKRLGIKNTEALRVYIGALEKHGAANVRPVAQKLLRSEGVKVKVEILNEFLFKGGFATRSNIPQPEDPSAGGPQVSLNKKALIICGFENLHGKKPLERIRQIILSMHHKDKKSALMTYTKLLKDEPKSSFLHTTDIVDLMKTMKKRKAFEVLPS